MFNNYQVFIQAEFCKLAGRPLKILIHSIHNKQRISRVPKLHRVIIFLQNYLAASKNFNNKLDEQ